MYLSSHTQKSSDYIHRTKHDHSRTPTPWYFHWWRIYKIWIWAVPSDRNALLSLEGERIARRATERIMEQAKREKRTLHAVCMLLRAFSISNINGGTYIWRSSILHQSTMTEDQTKTNAVGLNVHSLERVPLLYQKWNQWVGAGWGEDTDQKMATIYI